MGLVFGAPTRDEYMLFVLVPVLLLVRNVRRCDAKTAVDSVLLEAITLIKGRETTRALDAAVRVRANNRRFILLTTTDAQW